MPSIHPVFRRFGRRALAAALLAVCCTAARAADSVTLDIAAQPLAEAMAKFAEQSGIRAMYAAELLAGRKAPRVEGRLTPQQALEKLLAGSGLGYRFVAADAVRIERVPAERQTELATIEVREDASLSLQAGSIKKAKKELARVPGGTAVVDGEVVKEGVAAGAADLLGYVPGLVTQEPQAYANGATRIMMRGSAINSGASPIRGVKVLQDGIPLTMASGLTDTEAIDPWLIDRVEVYKGANAMQWGSSNLGGAINMVTPTGYTASPARARITVGSNVFRQINLSGGTALDNGWDVFAAVTSLEGDGFRDRAKEKMLKGFLSLGYRWNASNETRIFIDLQNNEYIGAGTLTKAEIASDYKQNPNVPNNPWTGYPVKRIALKHSMLLNEQDKLDISAYYHEKNFNFASAGVRDWHDLWQDSGVNLRHEINGKLGGMDNRFIWGGLMQWKKVRDWEYPLGADGVTRGAQDFEESDRYRNYELFFEDQLAIAKDLTLSFGGQWGYRYTESTRYLPLPPAAPITANSANASWSQFNPKIGLAWQMNEQQQIFGNISRSWEPPRRGDVLNFFNSPQLRDQSALTYEVGTRIAKGRTSYDLAFYHAKVSDEILIMETPPGSRTYAMANAPKAVHQGIEAGLETLLPLGWFSANDEMRVRGTYTWNNFKFVDDLTFGNSRLAGVPEHLGRIELQYRHPSSLSFGISVDRTSKMFADFANTQAAPGRTLLGAKLSYAPTAKLRLFLEGRNLTDERYVAFVSPQGNVTGADTRIYQPGAPRSVFAGAEFAY